MNLPHATRRPVSGTISLIALLTAVLLAGCSGSRPAAGPGWTGAPVEPPHPPPPPAVTEQPEGTWAAPRAMREFRGAWIATVDNIDWPSEPGLTVDAQQSELRRLLDQAVALRLNAIVFQVRPIADAVYRSDLEPTSYYVTGRQGLDIGYDPLAFAVDEAHRRGLELHAWFNPFRAGHPTMDSLYADSHVSVRHPEWVVNYGEQRWLDPGNPEASAHSLAVIEDVVRRYDIDGVHLDDYFYPYPISSRNGQEVPFPDTTSRAAAIASGDTLPLRDWRRANVDTFVEAMYDRVKRAKPWVKVGISPFGIWRPGYPEGVTGFDQYDRLFADARRWLREGWVDYFTPQLYWAIESEGQPYDRLLDWWISQNDRSRHIWPGNFTSRVILEGSSYWGADEIVRQIDVTRARPGADGNVHFSMKALMPGRGADSLVAASVYDRPALVPETRWLGGKRPGEPTVTFRDLGGRRIVDITPASGESPFLWHVRTRHEDGWRVDLVPGWRRMLVFEADWPDRAVVSAVTRLGQEGPDARASY